VQSESFNPAALDWWTSRCPELSQFEGLAIVPGSVNWTQPSDLSLTNVLLKGQIAPWMSGANAEEIQVSAEFSGVVKTSDGRVVNTAQRHPKQVKLKLTNLDTGTYSSAPQVQQIGEPIPFGLARRIFAIESIPQYQGTYTLVESEISGAIGVGNVLNISGGRAEWATMNAQVQRVSYDFTTGKTTISFGPAMHLGAGDLIERLRAQRGPRMIYLIGFNRQAAAASADVELGQEFPKENSTSGVPIQQSFSVYESDNPVAAGTPTALGAITLDAANREVKINADSSAGSISLKLGEASGKAVKLREISYIDTTGHTKRRIVHCSDEWTNPGDPALPSGGSKVVQLTLSPCETAQYGDAAGTVVGNDYIYCIDSAGSHIAVLKPFSLRRSTTDGQTVGMIDGSHTYAFQNATWRKDTRTDNYGSAVVFDEIIWPEYHGGDVIYASQVDGSGAYVDLNVDARTWAIQDTYCSNGTSQIIFIVGSTPFKP
jgi:hypothetical protein